MSDTKIRVLLERVEKHGGSVRWDYVNKSWLWARDLSLDDGEDLLVGVLNRDLIERGYGLDIDYYGPTDSVWSFEVVETDKEGAGAWGRILASEDGLTELEAVLHAWLAAAEAEGWQ